MKITILGRVPSKKNSRVNTRSGRSFPSKKYQEWHKNASKQLFYMRNDFNLFQGAFNGKLYVTFYMPDSRKCDITNKVESIMDLLVDNKWIEDDNWFVVSMLVIKCAGVDKKNPRCEIECL